MAGRAGLISHNVRIFDNTRWLNDDIEVRSGSGRSFNRGELFTIIIFWSTITILNTETLNTKGN